MGWVKLDDAFFTNEAALIAGLEGRALFLSGLCHMSRNLTDGKVDKRVLPTVAALAGVAPSVADTLVESGLWEDVGDHFLSPTYLKFNPSREKVLAEREAAAARMSARRSGEQTPNIPRSSPTPSRPVPLGSTESVVVDTQETDDGSPQVPDEVWAEYARLKLSRQARPVQNVTGWTSKVVRTAKKEHGAQARSWWSRFDLTAAQLAAALVEGKAGPYWTERKDPAA